MSEQQLTLNFEAGLVASYGSCREYIQARVHQQGRPVKSIAADMDYSPSRLNRKLAQSPGDSARFTLDDLEEFMTVTGDHSAINYLAEKYIANAENDEIRKLKEEIARLEQSRRLKMAQ